MKTRTFLKLKQLAAILLAWVIVGILMTVYDYLVLVTSSSQGPSEHYSFLLSLASNVASALIGTMAGGSLLVFYINVRYQDKPYGYTIIAVTLGFMIVISLIVIVLGVTSVSMRTGESIFHPSSVDAFKFFIRDTSRIKNIMIWSIVVALTQLVLQINSKFGQGVFGKIIQGKYNTPQEEHRIFMFLDLNSSTTIAEQLGNKKYHELLKDFFEDITNPILDNKGEIYQYVGDEVIVAWINREGTENNRCIKCFFDIKNQIDKNKEKYLSRYGFIPSFKAGIHSGKVVAGEVGIIKRDITYSGDVLNTTSRIQGMCKEFKSEIIVSSDLVSELDLSNQYHAEPLGSIKLRGKREEMFLSELRPLRLSA